MVGNDVWSVYAVYTLIFSEGYAYALNYGYGAVAWRIPWISNIE